MILSRYAQLMLIHGCDDWVSLRELAGLVPSDEVPDVEVRREVAALVVRELLDERLVTLGTATLTGFVEWDSDTVSALGEATEVLRYGEGSGWGFDLYLCNTTAGNTAAEEARRTLDPALWSWDA
jgi:hypothetical protein